MVILKDKKLLNSMTVWGGALLAMAQALENSGVVFPGTTVALSTAAASIGTLLTTVGFRRAIKE